MDGNPEQGDHRPGNQCNKRKEIHHDYEIIAEISLNDQYQDNSVVWKTIQVVMKTIQT
jgi:hypothetical protein